MGGVWGWEVCGDGGGDGGMEAQWNGAVELQKQTRGAAEGQMNWPLVLLSPGAQAETNANANTKAKEATEASKLTRPRP